MVPVHQGDWLVCYGCRGDEAALSVGESRSQVAKECEREEERGTERNWMTGWFRGWLALVVVVMVKVGKEGSVFCLYEFYREWMLVFLCVLVFWRVFVLIVIVRSEGVRGCSLLFLLLLEGLFLRVS